LLDHERIGALPDQPPRRLDFDAQAPGVECAGGPDRLAAAGPATPATAKASTANPVMDMRMALSPFEHPTVSQHGAGVNSGLIANLVPKCWEK
jgi:hypothetical protein